MQPQTFCVVRVPREGAPSVNIIIDKTPEDAVAEMLRICDFVPPLSEAVEDLRLRAFRLSRGCEWTAAAGYPQSECACDACARVRELRHEQKQEQSRLFLSQNLPDCPKNASATQKMAFIAGHDARECLVSSDDAEITNAYLRYLDSPLPDSGKAAAGMARALRSRDEFFPRAAAAARNYFQ